jgi:hypothetical protein
MKAQGNLIQRFLFAVLFLVVAVAGWFLYASAPGFSVWRYIGFGTGFIFMIGGIATLGFLLFGLVQSRR